ncbi:MAG: hypothetical protein DCC75_05330 [Proteobacteria bacterium]|nr:MAG: hypothetical protein DCC75_05330 [Pseudomonadota bacterium]
MSKAVAIDGGASRFVQPPAAATTHQVSSPLSELTAPSRACAQLIDPSLITEALQLADRSAIREMRRFSMLTHGDGEETIGVTILNGALSALLYISLPRFLGSPLSHPTWMGLVTVTGVVSLVTVALLTWRTYSKNRSTKATDAAFQGMEQKLMNTPSTAEITLACERLEKVQ